MRGGWLGRVTGGSSRAAARTAQAGGAPSPPAGAAAGAEAGTGRPAGPDDAVVPALTIDALGRKCPIPIIMLAARINEVPVGSVIAVLADDPAAETDVPAWCAMKSHGHVATRPLDRGWAILVRRSY